MPRISRANESEVEREVEAFIDRLGKKFEGDDRAFVAALEVVVDHAQTAIDAQREVMDEDDDDDE
jgi:hypothetical protein